jgi:hypothetical protein
VSVNPLIICFSYIHILIELGLYSSEAFIGGYPKNSTFGCVIGARTPEGREEFARYHKGAILVPGPVTDRLAGLAKAKDVFMVVGVIEREELTGKTGSTLKEYPDLISFTRHFVL